MARTEWSPRERIVYSAAQLIRTQGVSATGLREIVARAKAPRGSLQHYFPGGKDQLVREALAWSSRFAAGRIAQFMSTMEPPTPSGLFAAMVDQWRQEFTAKGFARGCPLVAAVTDIAAASDDLREVASSCFRDWQSPLREALTTMGVPAVRADSLALVMLSALEGAIVIARAHQDLAPLDSVAAELASLLDSAVG